MGFKLPIEIPVVSDVVDFMENAVDATVEAVGDGGKGAINTIGNVLEVASDPEKLVKDVVWDTVSSAFSQGVNGLVGAVGLEDELGPILKGIGGLIDQAVDIVTQVLRGINCLKWVESAPFWGLVTGIVGARAAGLVKTREDCTRFLQVSPLLGTLYAQFGKNLPIADMLSCAIDAAFAVPAPAPRPFDPGRGNAGVQVNQALGKSIVGQILSCGASVAEATTVAQRADVAAVSPARDKMDILCIEPDGEVAVISQVTHRRPGRTWEFSTPWTWPQGGRMHPDAPITAVSRAESYTDAFMVGPDGRVWTTASDSGSKGFKALWPINDLKAVPGSKVGAVSRGPNLLDIFVTGADGNVYTAAWQPGDNAWRGFWHVAGGKTHPGTPVTAVSRSRDHLDVFMVGLDGRVWTAAWEPDGRGWRGWWPIKDLKAARGSEVSVVSRAPNFLDIFVTGADGKVYTAAWHPGDEEWRGPWQVAGGRARPGTPIAAVSRSLNYLDVFMVGLDGRIWTAAYTPGVGWKGWWIIGKLETLPRSPISAVSHAPDKLDIFVRGADKKIYTAEWAPGYTSWRGWDRLAPTKLEIKGARRAKEPAPPKLEIKGAKRAEQPAPHPVEVKPAPRRSPPSRKRGPRPAVPLIKR